MTSAKSEGEREKGAGSKQETVPEQRSAPSHGSTVRPTTPDVAITAVEMARSAGVTPDDVRYWGRAGLVKKRRGGLSLFPVSEIPKVQLMGIFAKQLHMDAATAARLSDRLLPLYADRPDVVECLENLAEAVDSHIEELAEELLESGRSLGLHALLGPATEKENKP
jgi:hypothetical protein